MPRATTPDLHFAAWKFKTKLNCSYFRSINIGYSVIYQQGIKLKPLQTNGWGYVAVTTQSLLLPETRATKLLGGRVTDHRVPLTRHHALHEA